MSKDTVSLATEYKRKYPGTVAWRVKSHARVIDKHLNPQEEVLYAFAGQKNDESYNVFTSCVVAITNKRILVGMKRLFFGYFLWSITPDMFNDLTVIANMVFGKVIIDTVKEKVIITNLSKKSLSEIETNISENMMKLKERYIRED